MMLWLARHVTVRGLIGVLALWQGLLRAAPWEIGRSQVTFGDDRLFGWLLLVGGAWLLATLRLSERPLGRLAAAFLAAGWAVLAVALAPSNLGSAGSAAAFAAVLLVEAAVGSRC